MDDSTTRLVPYPPLPPLGAAGEEQGRGRAEASPATDASAAPPPPSSSAPSPPSNVAQAPDDSHKIALSILVISGQRKTFRFDSEMTVGRVKELIWSSWPAEWNTDPVQPPSPSYLRIIYRGRMLDDESTLSSNSLPVLPHPRTTVVHLSVRTFAIESPGDGKDGKDTDVIPSRPALHTRASSRIRSFVGAAPPSSPVITNPPAPSARRRRESAISASSAGTHSGGGCGCVIA